MNKAEVKHQFPSESELYKLIINTAYEGVWLVDNEHNTIYVNQKMVDMIGYSLDEIYSRPLFFCLDEAGIEQAKKGLAERRKGVSSAFEFKFIRKDGSELWTHMNVSPFLVEGEYRGALAMITDITAIKEKAKVQSDNYRNYQSLFEQSPIPLWDEDFSEIKKYIDVLKEQGIVDFRKYFNENQDALVECVSKLIVNNINQAVVDLNEANSKEEVLSSFRKLLNKKSAEYAIEQLVTIAENRTTCEFEAELRTLNDNIRYVHFKWSVVEGYEHNYGKVYLSTTDLTERIVNENISLQNANRQKEMLLKEIHHRVKNNLQIISSLLNLQMNTNDNDAVKNVLNISLNRVKSMATVHQMLYQSNDFSEIDYNAYLENFVSSLIESYKGQTNNVDLEINANGIKLNINTSIPLGLMINEIVTNSLKHGIPEDEPGQITIHLKKIKYPRYLLEIHDSGAGFENVNKARNGNTLGMQLIEGLTDQLNGKLELLNNGAGYRIEFDEVDQLSGD